MAFHFVFNAYEGLPLKFDKLTTKNHGQQREYTYQAKQTTNEDENDLLFKSPFKAKYLHKNKVAPLSLLKYLKCIVIIVLLCIHGH